LRLADEDGGCLLEIRDDGSGFDTGGDFTGHFGLTSMRERAGRLGGTLGVESAPGQGTVVRVRLPLARG
jgi:signal transduction histidine kinase